MTFDLSSITEAQVADVQLIHPVTKALLGAVITVASPEHPARKKINFERQRRLRAKFQKAGKVTFSDPAEDEQDDIEYLAACTLGWRGLSENGNDLAFSAQAAVNLYGKPELAWLRTQVRAALDDMELFIRTSAPG